MNPIQQCTCLLYSSNHVSAFASGPLSCWWRTQHMHGPHWGSMASASSECQHCSVLLVPGGLITVTVPVFTIHRLLQSTPSYPQSPKSPAPGISQSKESVWEAFSQVPLSVATLIRVAIFTSCPPVSREKVSCLLCPSPSTLDPVPLPLWASFPCPPAPSLAPPLSSACLLLAGYKHAHCLPTPLLSSYHPISVFSFTPKFL